MVRVVRVMRVQEVKTRQGKRKTVKANDCECKSSVTVFFTSAQNTHTL